MLFKVYLVKPIDDKTIKQFCNCSFCKGGLMRRDIAHYRAYTNGTAYSINWCYNNSNSVDLVEIVRKF